MAQPTNSFSSYDAVGNREDLSDVIWDISPLDTPILSMIAKEGADATYHEWQTDALAAVDGDNAVIEGADAETDASSATTRVGNYTQISDKVARVTGTQRKINSAGRSDEMDYQVAKKQKELKRDMETILCANNARVAGSDTVARELAGIPAWIATNTSAGVGGSDPAGTGADARTDGTQRALTESQLKTVLAAAWEAGGDPDCIISGSFNKQKASEFTGNSTRYDKAEDSILHTTVDVYVSDFGRCSIIPSRFSRSRDLLVLQKDMWALAELRPTESVELARTGDTSRRQVICEYTLVSRNEAASGIIADLTTS